jgi:hypothetical protein
MYRKEVNERSPMRVFEKSMHGGLGRGNVGVIASRPGIGKTPLLVQIALDDLLRDRRVLHISHEHAVDHVRAFYDEIFHDLATCTKLEDPETNRLEIERRRLIFSHLGHVDRSAQGTDAVLRKLAETVAFARDIAHFAPDVIIIDGFDFTHGTDASVDALGKLARDHAVELWVSSQTQASAAKPGALPPPLDRFYAGVSVIVFLEAEHNAVRLRLLKDHDNADLADLELRLGPHSMRILDQDVPPLSERPKDPRQFHLYSGGARGAEAAFGACAERWGLNEVNYSFEGHKLRERNRGVVMLGPADLEKGDFSLVYVSRRLGRVLSEVRLVRSVLQTIWHQVNAASQVFVVGAIQEDGTVRGGTGWGAELARLWKKPLFVFDQQRCTWSRWTGTAWETAVLPVISSESFAGLGTQNLTSEGRTAIHDLFLRSFGEPPS